MVNTLYSFMTVTSLPKDWISGPLLSLLFQNLICEERDDVRTASLEAWKTAIRLLSEDSGKTESVISQQAVLDWYAIMMTPLGVPIDVSTFYTPSMHVPGNATVERHNVDKNMIMQDLSLLSSDVVLRARVSAATAIAFLMVCWSSGVSLYRYCVTRLFDDSSAKSH